MKDKLYKNGHKGLYYKVRRFFLASIISATVIAGVSVSTYIAYRQSVKAETNEEEISVSETTEADNGETNSLLNF